MKEELKEIINHYGINAQQRKFAEEVFELQEAITIMEHEDDTNPKIKMINEYNVAEEIADCIVMLEQFKEYYNITDEQINLIKECKINRQMLRIEKGI